MAWSDKPLKERLIRKLASWRFTYESHDQDNTALYTLHRPDLYERCNTEIIMGICLNPIYRGDNDFPIGLMFESTVTFEKRWFHISPSLLRVMMRHVGYTLEEMDAIVKDDG